MLYETQHATRTSAVGLLALVAHHQGLLQALGVVVGGTWSTHSIKEEVKLIKERLQLQKDRERKEKGKRGTKRDNVRRKSLDESASCDKLKRKGCEKSERVREKERDGER